MQIKNNGRNIVVSLHSDPRRRAGEQTLPTNFIITNGNTQVDYIPQIINLFCRSTRNYAGTIEITMDKKETENFICTYGKSIDDCTCVNNGLIKLYKEENEKQVVNKVEFMMETKKIETAEQEISEENSTVEVVENKEVDSSNNQEETVTRRRRNKKSEQ